MKTGLEFIQRMQEDAEFRRQVSACPAGQERLAFLRSQGYDFTRFIRILDYMSAGPRSLEGLPRTNRGVILGKGPPGFWGRLGQIWRGFKSP
jgi:hypothetical protein